MYLNSIKYSFNIKGIIIYLINPILKNYYHFTFKFFIFIILILFNFEFFYFKILKYKFIQKILRYINNNNEFLIFYKLKLI